MEDQVPGQPVQPVQSANNSNEKNWIIGCYVPVINPLICAFCAARMPQSELCRFHLRQGLVLFGTVIIAVFVGLFSKTLSLMIWGIVLLLHVWGIFIALSGKKTEIPGAGQLALKIPEYYVYKMLTGKVPENKTEK